MRIKNQKMQKFLNENGIKATPKYLNDGSLKGTWRLYNLKTVWTMELAEKLTALGFKDYSNQTLGKFSGNGGMFSVFVRGHNEFLPLNDPKARPVGIRYVTAKTQDSQEYQDYSDSFITQGFVSMTFAEWQKAKAIDLANTGAMAHWN